MFTAEDAEKKLRRIKFAKNYLVIPAIVLGMVDTLTNILANDNTWAVIAFLLTMFCIANLFLHEILHDFYTKYAAALRKVEAANNTESNSV